MKAQSLALTRDELETHCNSLHRDTSMCALLERFIKLAPARMSASVQNDEYIYLEKLQGVAKRLALQGHQEET